MTRIGRCASRGVIGGLACLMLAACGGGSGGGVNSVSSATSTTTTTTTPVVNYNDAEYQRSNAAVDAGALTAYNAGASGTGVTIAFLDTGINTGSAEFSGRISSASRDFGGNGTISDVDGHGTSVAAVAAAARNGTDIEGVAWNATVLTLRSDTAGTCSTSSGCGFDTDTLAIALDYARSNGAKVVNMSLGGSPATPSMVAAINRATAAGLIIVIAGGNDATAQPDPLAQVAANSASRGLVIIAGSHDADGTLSSFSDKAGNYGAYYLTALGNGVRTFNQNGADETAGGTSYATPVIAGAVALIEQAFPNLTPAQVVALLYSSATDAGTAGVDSTYGHGLLNIAKAFAPQGTTALAGSTVLLSSADETVTSAAMGDATLTGSSFGKAVVLDQLGRAYLMNVAGALTHAAPQHLLAQGVGQDLRTTSQTAGRLSISSTLATGWSDRPEFGLALGRRGFDQGVDARPVNGSAVLQIDKNTATAVGFAQQGQILADTLAPDGAAGGWLVARGAAETPGFATSAATSFAFAHSFGRTLLTVSAEHGTLARVSLTDPATPAYTQMSVRARHALGRLTLGLGVASLDEQGTVLGARLAAAMGRSGAITRYVDAEARLALTTRWSLGAQWRSGWTRTAAASVLQHSGLESRSAAADLSYDAGDHRFGLRVAMPPRVTGGGLNLVLPTSYDYTTGAIGYSSSLVALTPRGQERDVEATWGFRAPGGSWLDTNLYWRKQPANLAEAPDDFGTALRYSLTF
jgi:hypothetical protein